MRNCPGLAVLHSLSTKVKVFTVQFSFFTPNTSTVLILLIEPKGKEAGV
jgi:hypothetical protein